MNRPRNVVFIECLETDYFVQHLTLETVAELEEWQYRRELRGEWWDASEMSGFLEMFPPRVKLATERAYRANHKPGKVWIVSPSRDVRERVRDVPAPKECCGIAVMFMHETIREYWPASHSPHTPDLSRLSFAEGRIMYDGEVWAVESTYVVDPSCRAEMHDIRCWMAAERTALFKEELMAKVWHPQSALFKHYMGVDDEI